MREKTETVSLRPLRTSAAATRRRVRCASERALLARNALPELESVPKAPLTPTPLPPSTGGEGLRVCSESSPLSCTQGRGAGGEGCIFPWLLAPSPQPLSPRVQGERGFESVPKAPLTPTPLPLSTGGEGLSEQNLSYFFPKDDHVVAIAVIVAQHAGDVVAVFEIKPPRQFVVRQRRGFDE